jgi:exoribonuclease R
LNLNLNIFNRNTIRMQGLLITKNYNHFSIMSPDYKKVLAEFDGPRLANPALHGDLIEQAPDGTMRVIKRSTHPQLAGLLDLKSMTIHGLTARNVPIYLFYPFDRRYPPMRVGCSERDRTTNRIALVEFNDFNRGDMFPRANLVRLLGISGSMDIEREALAHTASPYCSPKERASLRSAEFKQDSYRELIDEGWMTANIDPDNCKDIDDVISFCPTGSGAWGVIISIADVDDIVRMGSPIDLYAQKTLQTIYDNGSVIRPMLPPVFSEGICSLTADGAPKPVIGLQFRFVPTNDVGSKIVDMKFVKLHLKNKKSYTYDNVYSALTEDFPVSIMAEVASEIAGSPVTDSHEWIAELMKFYNLQAAAIIGSNGMFRSHDGPRLEQLEMLQSILDEKTAASLSNSAATYVCGPSPGGHHGFGGALYCHATSPIRRYADLYNQRLIKAHIDGCELSIEVDALTFRMNEVSKAARQFEKIAHFTRCIEVASGESVEAIMIGPNKIYVKPWRMTFKISLTETIPLGTTISVRYAYNPAKFNWKERMVFAVQ